MKLSKREVDLVSNIPKIRRRRVVGSWLGVAIALTLCVVALAFDVFGQAASLIISVFLGLSIAEALSATFRSRTEEQLIDVLQRYLNRDPDVIAQMADDAG